MPGRDQCRTSLSLRIIGTTLAHLWQPWGGALFSQATILPVLSTLSKVEEVPACVPGYKQSSCVLHILCAALQV